MNARALTVHDIRPCLEGAVPAVMATCGPDGMPNVAYLSQVYYVDAQHVALSFQFFNKTRRNILGNPQASLLVMDPGTAAFYRLQLLYLRTETEGALFEGMRAQLAGLASHAGMAAVFKLLGADVYRVEKIDSVPGQQLPAPPARSGLLPAVRRSSARLARCTSTEELLRGAMAVLAEELGVPHALLLMHDEAHARLYTLASLGYAQSGIGSEIALGHGVIGMAARERTPIRIGHMTNASSYNHAVRGRVQADAPELALETEIPYPGLAAPRSQMALPMLAAGRLLGVLFVESEQELAFDFQDEDALSTVAAHLGAALDGLQQAEEAAAPGPMRKVGAGDTVGAADVNPSTAPSGPPLSVRHYASNDSVFIDGQYLIKGVAGAILWKLLREFTQEARTEFSNRELRLDSSLGLPEVADNLEARLVLLQRRLREQCPHLQLQKGGRGRISLCVSRPLQLVEAG